MVIAQWPFLYTWFDPVSEAITSAPAPITDQESDCNREQSSRAEAERPVNADQAADNADGQAAEGAQTKRRHAEKADEPAAKMSGGRYLNDGLCRRIERKVQNAGAEQQDQRQVIVAGRRKHGDGGAPEDAAKNRVSDIRVKPALAFEEEPSKDGARRTSHQQGAIRKTCLASAEVSGESGHQSLNHIPDKQ